MTAPATVESIKRPQGILLLSNGETGWVTLWLDANGAECEPHDAMACIGTDRLDNWYSVDLTQFEGAFIQ